MDVNGAPRRRLCWAGGDGYRVEGLTDTWASDPDAREVDRLGNRGYPQERQHRGTARHRPAGTSLLAGRMDSWSEPYDTGGTMQCSHNPAFT